ncbi:uncharacterized protein LOC131148132 [Malania oleifera]|uniref:uncharacterized protein LOC131148132 n=1 Tax=Malania oleifera TaxID=397392 RepID=UPI0025ADFD83|nr:uncharacterized protein LOC131148132 [Malania oleifera]
MRKDPREHNCPTVDKGSSIKEFMRLNPYTFEGGPNPVIAENWVQQIEERLEVLDCMDEQKVRGLLSFSHGWRGGDTKEKKKKNLSSRKGAITPHTRTAPRASLRHHPQPHPLSTLCPSLLLLPFCTQQQGHTHSPSDFAHTVSVHAGHPQHQPLLSSLPPDDSRPPTSSIHLLPRATIVTPNVAAIAICHTLQQPIGPAALHGNIQLHRRRPPSSLPTGPEPSAASSSPSASTSPRGPRQPLQIVVVVTPATITPAALHGSNPPGCAARRWDLTWSALQETLRDQRVVAAIEFVKLPR